MSHDPDAVRLPEMSLPPDLPADELSGTGGPADGPLNRMLVLNAIGEALTSEECLARRVLGVTPHVCLLTPGHEGNHQWTADREATRLPGMVGGSGLPLRSDATYPQDEPLTLHPRPVVDREALIQALHKAGAYCGECNFEDWDLCEDCLKILGDYADAVLALLPAEDDSKAPDSGNGLNRTDVLNAMIAHIYEDDRATGLVAQGIPTREWDLLSMAADAVEALDERRRARGEVSEVLSVDGRVLQVDSSTTALRLHSSGLLSKWGFNDGDMPDDVLDLLDGDSRFDGWGLGALARINWHTVLQVLVRRHLVPAIEKAMPDHAFTVTDLVTAHNPIRIEKIDGCEIDWRNIQYQQEFIFDPEWVDLTWEQVSAAILETS